jgi:hypothetical protein
MSKNCTKFNIKKHLLFQGFNKNKMKKRVFILMGNKEEKIVCLVDSKVIKQLDELAYNVKNSLI